MQTNKPSDWSLADIGGGNYSITNGVLSVASLTMAEALVLMRAASTPIMFRKTADGAGDGVITDLPEDGTVQIVGTTSSGSGTVSGTVYVSNDGVNWISAGTFSFTATTGGGSDGFGFTTRWAKIKVYLAVIPANCTVTAYLGGC